MDLPNSVFVDTSFWIELILVSEIHHQLTADLLTREIKTGSKLFTCDYVLDESWTRFITNNKPRAAKILKQKVEAAQKSGQLMVFYTDQTVFNQAWPVFIKYSDHRLSFTDAVIATYMDKFKIKTIFTLDQGFRKVGYRVFPELKDLRVGKISMNKLVT